LTVRFARCCRLLVAGAGSLFTVGTAEAAKRRFDIPAADTTLSLNQFFTYRKRIVFAGLARPTSPSISSKS